MVLNPEKCSFILLGVDDSLQTNLICGDEILKHLLNITKNANKKFNTLMRFQKYTTNIKSLYFPPLFNRNSPPVR